MSTEKDKFEKALELTEELVNFDFTPDKDDFDFKKYFDSIFEVSKQNDLLKREEADNIIKNLGPDIIGEEAMKMVEEKKEKIFNYLRMYDANKDLVKNMTEHELDKIYAISNYIVNSYINSLNGILFNFKFTLEEFKFTDRLLLHELKYNADDVFNFVDFYESFWVEAKKEFEKDKGKPDFLFQMNMKNILIFHHLIKGYCVKGAGNDFTHFRNILYRIAMCNKLFNAYNIVTERIKEDCKIWGGSLDQISNERKIAAGDLQDAQAEIRNTEQVNS